MARAPTLAAAIGSTLHVRRRRLPPLTSTDWAERGQRGLHPGTPSGGARVAARPAVVETPRPGGLADAIRSAGGVGVGAVVCTAAGALRRSADDAGRGADAGRRSHHRGFAADGVVLAVARLRERYPGACAPRPQRPARPRARAGVVVDKCNG
eukprot:ctg_2310.g560